MQLTVRDAAQLLSVSEKTVYRWIEQKDIPVHRVNEQLFFSKAELLEWATARRIKVSATLFEDSDLGSGPLPALSTALEAGAVVPKLPGKSKSEVLRAMVDQLTLPPNFDREMLLQMLMAREGLGSTGIGDGIAIPHVRNPVVLNVPKASMTLCYLDQPIEFGSVDGKPVHTLFSLVSPTIRVHLHLLSRLSTALLDSKVRTSILRRDGRPELLAEIRRVEMGFTRVDARPEPGR